jgi:hypothetical protein
VVVAALAVRSTSPDKPNFSRSMRLTKGNGL